MRFVRNLTEEEMVENYSQSYNFGAGSFGKDSGHGETEETIKWPHKFTNDQLKEGEEPIEKYVDKKYFKYLEKY